MSGDRLCMQELLPIHRTPTLPGMHAGNAEMQILQIYTIKVPCTPY